MKSVHFEMNKSRCHLRHSFYILNCIFGMLGIGFIWFGVKLTGTSEDIELDTSNELAATVVCIVGVVVILIAVFGIIAAMLEDRKMLMSYALLVVLLLVIQLLLTGVSRSVAGGAHTMALKQAFNELLEPDTPTNGTLSRYEEWLHCCGKNSAEDYLQLDKMPTSSCCKDRDCSKIYNLFVIGCEQKFNEHIEEKTRDFNMFSWLVVGVEIFCSICSCIIIDRIKNRTDRNRFYA